MKLAVLAAVLAVGAFAATANAASFVNEADWLNSLPVAPITFDAAAVAPIDFPPGITDLDGFNVEVTGGATGDASLNAVPNWVFDFETNKVLSVKFIMDQPIVGFSGIWSNTFVQDGFVVSTPFNTYDLHALVDPLNAAFIGFTESQPFTEITFTSGFVGGDDFVFWNTFQYAVPEPASLLLLSLVLSALRRR
jgi:hypothetical protein